MKTRKPELLLPAGNTESFYAALEGGADAIFMGLRNFNARGRASNFSEGFFLAALQEAKRRKVKIYATLNTVIKNREIESLLDVLAFLEQAGVDAIIIQDWGVYYLAKRYFPKLVIHASTQMGNHNSLGVDFSARKGITRVILARELTMDELERIANNAQTELELFIHGALCYSMSGMCFFSSYLGGRGANRGLCRQPCRMVYEDNKENKFLFSLKDNQQFSNLEKLKTIGIHSLKVEGRMKSADYVFRVAKAYRMAIDHPDKQQDAEELLQLDFGREKVSYFLGRDVKDALADSSNTGIPVGFVQQVRKQEVVFDSETVLMEGDRIRVRNSKNENTFNTRLLNLKFEAGRYSFSCDNKETVQVGDEIFWIGRKAKALPSKFRKVPAVNYKRVPLAEKQRIRKGFQIQQKPSKPKFFVRIDQPDWLPWMRFEMIDELILSFTVKQLDEFDFSDRIVQQHLHAIAIELPKFISEKKLEGWQKLIQKLEGKGVRKFFVSHLSQKLLFGKSSQISTNENVYIYNDAAAKLVKENQVADFCYPFENDFENLKSMQNKQGIVLLHAHPELFYSRMPVSVANEKDRFANDSKKTFRKMIKNGMTIVVPEIPVSLFQYKEQLMSVGFKNFMIDLGYEVPSKQKLKKVMGQFQSGQQCQPSTNFNFKKGLQ